MNLNRQGLGMAAGEKRVDPRALDRRAADVIKAQILSARFPPGYRLVETSLALQLDVSRGTLRSALRMLTHEGLVEQVAYSKWLVPELSAEDAEDLLTFRAGLFGLAARGAAERRPQRLAEELDSARQALSAATGGANDLAARKVEARLRQTIIDMSGQPRLDEQLRICSTQLERYLVATDAPRLDRQEIAARLTALTSAIAAGEAGTAERLGRDLAMCEGAALLEMLRSSIEIQRSIDRPAA